MNWPTQLTYPIVAIGDIHGQSGYLGRLIRILETLSEWPDCSIVFVGDYVDRGPDTRGVLDLILDLARRHAVSAVMGNHDYALVRATGLDGAPPSAYWIRDYTEEEDCGATFRSYGVAGDGPRDWARNLGLLRDAMPESHRDFLANLPWLVEAPGHLFLHNGLSFDLEQAAEEQIEALRIKDWAAMTPRPGTPTALDYNPEYPVWLGADRRLSFEPLKAPGRVQVTGHKRAEMGDANATRIRLDTAGGRREPLTGCLLRSPSEPPQFFYSNQAGAESR